jgi:parvulin-like peptidyl-prolyl isomerase
MARCLATARAKRERRRDEPAKISVKQIIVKHSAAKQAPPGLKRTREDACMRALEARGMLEAGADFDGAIEEYSEEPGAPGTRGRMPDIRRTDVAPRFADAAFELEVNQVSAVVETEQGFHVIIRTE